MNPFEDGTMGYKLGFKAGKAELAKLILETIDNTAPQGSDPSKEDLEKLVGQVRSIVQNTLET